MIARGTVDEFVKTVLETKAALMDALVEGTLLVSGESGEVQADVLSELKRMMNALSVHTVEVEEPQLLDVLQKASNTYLAENASHLREAHPCAAASIFRRSHPNTCPSPRGSSAECLPCREFLAKRQVLHARNCRRRCNLRLSGFHAPRQLPTRPTSEIRTCCGKTVAKRL